MRFGCVTVMLVLVLTGCGGGDSTKGATPAKKTPTKTTLTKAAAAEATPTIAAKTAAPTVAAPTGIPAPEDLSDFLCSADAKGVWNAVGILRNESKKSATYQVTVFVGLANGKDAQARTQQVGPVLAGGSTKISVAAIPAAKDATQCYVQVLRKQ